MRAVVIENEYDVDNYIKAFIKDNPKLFSHVEEMTFAQHRGEEAILEEVLKSEAIIVATTWMYKDQVEEYLDAFLNEKFPVKSIFVHHFVNTLNEWKTRSWDKKLFDKVKQIFEKGFKIYDFMEDPDRNDRILDGLNMVGEKDFPRSKYTYFEIKYSKENNLFYIDHKYYNLKSQIEEEQKNLKNS